MKTELKSFAKCTIIRTVGKPWQRVVHSINPDCPFGERHVGFVTINGMEVPVIQVENYTWRLLSSVCVLAAREEFVTHIYPRI
jgi:hypothetical protein